MYKASIVELERIAEAINKIPRPQRHLAIDAFGELFPEWYFMVQHDGRVVIEEL